MHEEVEITLSLSLLRIEIPLDGVAKPGAMLSLLKPAVSNLAMMAVESSVLRSVPAMMVSSRRNSPLWALTMRALSSTRSFFLVSWWYKVMSSTEASNVSAGHLTHQTSADLHLHLPASTASEKQPVSRSQLGKTTEAPALEYSKNS